MFHGKDGCSFSEMTNLLGASQFWSWLWATSSGGRREGSELVGRDQPPQVFSEGIQDGCRSKGRKEREVSGGKPIIGNGHQLPVVTDSATCPMGERVTIQQLPVTARKLVTTVGTSNYSSRGGYLTKDTLDWPFRVQDGLGPMDLSLLTAQKQVVSNSDNSKDGHGAGLRVLRRVVQQRKSATVTDVGVHDGSSASTDASASKGGTWKRKARASGGSGQSFFLSGKKKCTSLFLCDEDEGPEVQKKPKGLVGTQSKATEIISAEAARQPRRAP